VRRNLRLAADPQHHLYLVVANLKACSSVVTGILFQALCLEG